MPRIEYKYEMILGVIGGLILFAVGFVSSPTFYLKLIELGEKWINLSEEVARLLATFFIVLASFGGLTVIVGSVFIGFGRRRIGGWFIGVGAGISLLSLLMKIYLLGPVISELVGENRFIDALNLFGVEMGLTGIGALLSFLATLTNYRWMVYSFFLALLNMYIGVTINPLLLELLVSQIGVSETYLVYIYNLELLVSYVGLLYLIIMLLVGANHFKIAKFLSTLTLLAILPSVVLVSLTVYTLFEEVSLLELFRFGLQSGDMVSIIVFIIKAKPVKPEKKKKRSKK